MGIDISKDKDGNLTISNTFSVEGIPHEIVMISDVPHILKNIRNGLLKNKSFKIDEKYVKEFDLATNEVRLSTIQKVVDLQKDMELKIAPHLKPNMVNPKMSPFDKMHVNPARSVLSRETANAIRFCIEHYPEKFNKEDLTTAVFIEHVGDWFEIMNNRKLALAFSKHKPEVYDKYLDWLIHFMEFFQSTKLHPKQQENSLKPTQKGVLMTTMSILMVQKDLLLEEVGFRYVMSARFSNDCIGKKHGLKLYDLFALNTSCF